MSTPEPTKTRIPRWQKAAMIAPVAAAVIAWSASHGTPDDNARATPSPDAGIPTVPASGLKDPANYTSPPSLGPQHFTDPNYDSTDPDTTAANAGSEAPNGIPAAAVTAYQRSDAVLAQADPACRLPWELLAAIGRVESDHGRHDDNILGDDGKSRPGLFGPPLDGRSGTALVSDTDDGAYDEDRIYDRAVGPMQFIPSTWEIVGVDADGDEIRDPQDIDDAALAAGVYLCAGDNDLSTDAGQRAAVFSYNHSDAYVELVLAIMTAYADGNYTPVANGQPSDADATVTPARAPDKPKPGTHRPKPSTTPANNGGGDNPKPGGDNGGGNTNPKPGGGNEPPVEEPKPASPLGPVTDTVTDTVDPVVIATNKCTQALSAASLTATPARVHQCVAAYHDGGMTAVNNLIGGLLDTLGGVVGGLGGSNDANGGGVLGNLLGG